MNGFHCAVLQYNVRDVPFSTAIKGDPPSNRCEWTTTGTLAESPDFSHDYLECVGRVKRF